jgi:hypothetical protein
MVDRLLFLIAVYFFILAIGAAALLLLGTGAEDHADEEVGD